MCNTINKELDKMFSRYVAPNHKWAKEWKTERQGRMVYLNMRNRIKELLNMGYKVRCGYMASTVRDSHIHYIFYK